MANERSEVPEGAGDVSGGAVADWIAVDWGTSNLRVWAMSREGAVLAHRSSNKGMGGLAPDAFESALLELIDGFLPPDRVTPVLACGMVGAREGWCAAPYNAVPCAPLSLGAMVQVLVQDPRIAVRILPGLKQEKPADVMRGEETQIGGYQALNPAFDGVICLPGTHTKWVLCSAGEVVSFQTFMTGELFSLLGQGSVLRHGLAKEGWDGAAFEAALDEAISHPQTVAARLFALRAEALLSGLSPVAARSRLSGLLIGIELAAARPYWLGQEIAIIGNDATAAVYQQALARQGAMAALADGEAVTLAGLTAAYRSLS